MVGVTGAVGEVGVGICGFGMDVRFEEAVFQADQDIQEGQLIGGGGDGELDGGVKRWCPRPREENVVDETFPVSWLTGTGLLASWASSQPMKRLGADGAMVSPWQCRRSAASGRLQS